MKKLLFLLFAVVAIATTAQAQDMLNTPLTLEAITAGSIKMNNPSSSALPIEYSKDGTTWVSVNTSPTIVIDVAAGDVVRLRGNNAQYGNNPEDHNISSTAEVYVYGNIMSLVHAADFATNTELTEPFAFKGLFCAGIDTYNGWQIIPNNTIKSHPTKDLVLPSSFVPCSCYADMFAGCEALERAPELPATRMDDWWYDSDTDEYYDGSIDCYMDMFRGCKNLVQGPSILPSTQLVHGVYQWMFEGCSSLTKAPLLPAEKLSDQAYTSMFEGCTSLNYVKCLATDITEEACVENWLRDVAPSGTFIKAASMTWPVGESGIPAEWTVADANDFDPYTTPLTLEAAKNGTTFTIANPRALTIEYSTDGGTTWTSSSADITISGIAAGGTVLLRGDNASYSNGTRATSTIISCDKDFYVYGNLMSLAKSTGYATITELTEDYAFYDLFYQNTHLKNHADKDLVLPATTLSSNCYAGMFNGCTAMTRTPELPATTLATRCYYFMFSSCSSLASASALPATTLADECYYAMFQATALTTAPALPAKELTYRCYMNMFRGSKSLTTAPELPATTLAESCYEYMFHTTGLTSAPALPAMSLSSLCYFGMFLNCKGITEAPVLPATTLAPQCYLGMFYNAGLTTAPELPALTLDEYCYKQMFRGCTSLTDVPDLPATTLAESCYEQMFMGCTSLVNAPDLAATTLADCCCNYMFAGCTNLTKAPVLPATTLAMQCYQRMFDGCTSLVTAPELPATTLADLCYNDMFWECTGLKNAPVLPATTLADYCYTMMFLGCTSLEKAPVLPAATLTPGCYEHMFMNCNSLNYVKCLATDLGDESSTDGWLTNVAATGTFVQPAGVDWSGKGTTEGTWGDPGEEVPCTFVHGIPEGWTIQEIEGESFDLTVSAAGVATLYLDFPVTIPDNANILGVFYVNSIDGHVMLMKRLHDYIPADNGVIIMANPGTFTFNGTDDEMEAINDNLLQGTIMTIPVSSIDGTVYTLGHGKNSGYIGFHKYTGSNLPANKAFFVRNGSSEVNEYTLLLDNEDGTTTAIGCIKDNEFIPDAVYDLQGRRVERPGKGVYIMNGKKHYVK